MSEPKVPRIKITQSYRHPKTGALIVHYEFDLGNRGNINFPPSMLEGMTKREVKDHVKRTLENSYREAKRQQAGNLKTTLKTVASEMNETEIE